MFHASWTILKCCLGVGFRNVSLGTQLHSADAVGVKSCTNEQTLRLGPNKPCETKTRSKTSHEDF